MAFGMDGLTNGQRRAVEAVESGRNVFLTGFGGTGKSYALSRIIDWANSSGRNTIVCAPTGIAALNVGGSTIHRTLGIGPMDSMMPYDRRLKPTSPLYRCDLMIVDEVSMCRADLFDKLSRTLERVGKARESIGLDPCQLVVVGDFYQLPPVLTQRDRDPLRKLYGEDIGRGYAFSGREWKKWDFAMAELTECVRQDDAEFVDALNACRVGDARGIDWISSHCSESQSERAIVLCGRNAQADAENRQRMDALPGIPRTYRAESWGTVNPGEMLAPKNLTLKRGARVMALANKSSDTYMNGSLGTVVNIAPGRVVVDFDDGNRSVVTPHEWRITRPVLDGNKVRSETIGSFRQIPLKPAWAITIHKSQGQTFEEAHIYPQCWEPGQLYTAFSRLKSVGGMSLAFPASPKSLIAAEEVRRFMGVDVGDSGDGPGSLAYEAAHAAPDWKPKEHSYDGNVWTHETPK